MAETAANPESGALYVRNVSKEFAIGGQKVLALSHADLTVPRGEFICLVGASGCGKTTLLRIIAGFETATEIRAPSVDSTLFPEFYASPLGPEQVRGPIEVKAFANAQVVAFCEARGQQILSSSYEYRLRRQNGGLRIAQKKILLLEYVIDGYFDFLTV